MIYKNQNNNNFQSSSEITKERDELKEKIANIEFLTIALEEIFLFRANNDNIWKIYTKAIQEIIKGKEKENTKELKELIGQTEFPCLKLKNSTFCENCDKIEADIECWKKAKEKRNKKK